MKVALAALRSEPGGEDANLAGLAQTVASVAGQVDLVMTGEAFGQGFEAITDQPATDLAIAWELGGPEIASVQRLARRYKTAICLGFIERAVGRLHSSTVVISGSGELVVVYRRMSAGWRAPDADPSVYVEGDSPVTFELAGKRCTIALCGDLWVMPERFMDLGADVLLWPIFVNITPESWVDEHLRDYASQALAVAPDTLLVNSVAGGTSDTLPGVCPSFGGAAWFSAGSVIEQLPMGQPGVLVVDLP